MLPNFLVIGAPRAGTTYIYQNISSHPEIFLPTPKELHFFDRHYEKGIEYYEDFFKNAADYKAIGEATPAYLHTKCVAERIKQNLNNIKFIVCLRNPVDRLYSEFWNVKAKFTENKDISFEEKIRLKPEFIEEGFYDEHLERYFSMFPKENFLILFFDEIVKNPANFLKKIYTFLEVDPNFISPLSKEQINAADSKKHLSKNLYLYYAQRILFKAGLVKLSHNLAAKNKSKIPKMLPETRKWLAEQIYFDHNRNLEKLLNIDLSHWV